MGLGERLRARAHGDVPAGDLLAYARAGADAYDLVDEQPGLAAWCAFLLQTYGDRLVASGREPGFVPAGAAQYARVLFELVEQWLERARSGTVAVYVPQPLPQGTLEPQPGVLTAMRETLEAARVRLAADPQLEEAAAYVERLWRPDAGEELRLTIGRTLHGALERAYELGQTAARPDLVRQERFDPWCLTDPLVRHRLEPQAACRRSIDRLWAEVDRERVLAIQRELDAAVDAGAVDFLPSEGIPVLSRLAEEPPWPGIYFARAAVTVAGRNLAPGERFVVSVREPTLVVADPA